MCNLILCSSEHRWGSADTSSPGPCQLTWSDATWCDQFVQTMPPCCALLSHPLAHIAPPHIRQTCCLPTMSTSRSVLAAKTLFDAINTIVKFDAKINNVVSIDTTETKIVAEDPQLGQLRLPTIGLRIPSRTMWDSARTTPNLLMGWRQITLPVMVVQQCYHSITEPITTSTWLRNNATCSPGKNLGGRS